jgi:hypothetical protein
MGGSITELVRISDHDCILVEPVRFSITPLSWTVLHIKEKKYYKIVSLAFLPFENQISNDKNRCLTILFQIFNLWSKFWVLFEIQTTN